MSRWICTSMPPGMTYLPVASMVWSTAPARASVRAGSSSAATVSPSISTSAADDPVAVTTVPPLMRVRMVALLRLRQQAVGVGAPVTVELPQVPDLFEHAHVQVAPHALLAALPRHLPHHPP